MQEYVIINANSLWTSTAGKGEPVIFCHGGPGLWNYLEPVSSMIEDVAACHSYDQRGCGRSDGSPPHTVASNVDDIERLRIHWSLDKITLLGHSWGANLALAYALEYPDRVEKLVYMCGTGIGYEWSEEYKKNRSSRLTEAQAGELAELKKKMGSQEWKALDRRYCELAWTPDFSKPEDAPAHARQLFRPNIHPNYAVNEELWNDWKSYIESPDLERRVRALTVPTLVIAGKDDPRPSWALKEFSRLLPNAHYVEIGEAGHYPWLEQPELVKKYLRSFLK